MQIAESKAVSRFPARMEVRVPTALRDAVEIAAERQNTKSAEWARRALMAALEAEGIRLRGHLDEAALD